MSWLDNAVIYHIFIDRFAGYDSRKDWHKSDYMGGNLRGITEKLPYIKELGVNAVWISPFFKGTSFHGYHVTDFFSVDERYGTEEDLQELINAVHKLKMKIIADMVPNHVSSKHPYFLETKDNPDSKYRNWFFFNENNDYLSFLHYKELVKLNLDNQDTFDHVLQSAEKWLELGIDGYRVDHIIGLSNENVLKLINGLKSKYQNSVYIGEAWMYGIKYADLKTIRIPRKWLIRVLGMYGSELLYKNYQNLLDGVLDFKTANLLEKFVLTGREKYLHKIYDSINKRHPLLSINFLDNHDMQRFLARVEGDKQKLRLAAKAQFSLGQPSIIYYGDEVGMSNYKLPAEGTSHADIYARQPMVWDEEKQDKQLLNYYKELIHTTDKEPT